MQLGNVGDLSPFRAILHSNLCLQLWTAAQDIFFRVRENPGLEHSQVNVYDHKKIYLTIKPEAYTSTKTPNL